VAPHAGALGRAAVIRTSAAERRLLFPVSLGLKENSGRRPRAPFWVPNVRETGSLRSGMARRDDGASPVALVGSALVGEQPGGDLSAGCGFEGRGRLAVETVIGDCLDPL
jgi:hypothetical protein